MRPEYEQMELDTRKALDIAIYKVAEDAVATAREMVEASQVAPSMVRNRLEAYGIAAEQYSRIAKAVSAIKADTATLLGTLADPNFPAIEATSSIANSTMEAAATIIKAAAEMKRQTAVEILAEEGGGDGFEEAEPAEAGEIAGGDEDGPTNAGEVLGAEE